MAVPAMTVVQARKVLWLRNNPRPMGELLDEGYLNQNSLAWAAEKAYSPVLKQAAQVLLDSFNQVSPKSVHADSIPEPVSVSMNIEDARATVWPFRELKGQTIGTLLDSKQLSLKDLGYAIENSHDKRVRDAAITLTLNRLNQVIKEPDKPAGFIKVISGGRNYSERKQYQLMMIGGLLIGAVGATLLTILVFIYFLSRAWIASHPASKPLPPPYVIMLNLLVLVVFLVIFTSPFYVLNKVLDRIVDRSKLYRKGEEGEERVNGIISQVLDDNWYLFRNVELPGRNKGDLDAVLVGPGGVWVLETKAYSGTYRNIGAGWEYRTGSTWKASRSNPGEQARKNAVRLNNFLKVDGIQQWITPAVIWSGLDSSITVENPTVAVWTLERLPDELGNIWDKTRVSDETRQKIVEKLTKLCKKPDES